MNSILAAIKEWIKDPFGRRELTEKHNRILFEMYETRQLAGLTRSQRQAFPIIRMVGDNTARGRHNVPTTRPR
jgi:hypothetical protein